MDGSFIDLVAPKSSRAKHLGCVLSNGVRCIFIQDLSAKMPTAAMSIHAGQLNDPECLPGLAHFCEHMLFMGTEKFAKEDEYNAYISKHNGFCNAFTSDFDTVYYFQISDEGLEGALDRFLEFFVAPNFNPSAVDREVQAVHSEDEKNHSVDYWRLDELYRALHNPKHPRHRYGNGNFTTLVEEPRQKNLNLRGELQRFYSENYVSSASCIAVYSTRAPEDVLKLIKQSLMGMKTGVKPSFHFLGVDDGLFEKSLTPLWVNIRTLKKLRQLHIVWPVRSSVSLWSSVPSSYISYILGHECNNSVLGVLKARGLATGMVAGSRRVDDDFESFFVNIILTLEGFRHLNDIIMLIYHSIGQSIQKGIRKDVYEQMKEEEMLRFESCEVNSPVSHCVELAMSGLICDLKHAWVGGQVVLEDNYEACLDYARQLTPRDGIVILKWSEFPLCGEAGAVGKGTMIASSTGEDDHDDEERSETCTQTENEDDTLKDDLFQCLPTFAQRKVDQVTRFHRALYSQMSIPDSHIDSWTQALQPPYPEELGLPTPNPYLTTDFTIFSPEEGEFARIVTYPFRNGTIIVRKDHGHHRTFTCAIRLVTLSPAAYTSPLNRMYMQVACSILKDALTELSYYGELASLSNSLSAGQGGIDITISGPYQHIFRFFHDILLKIFDTETLQSGSDKYDTYADQFLRSLQSMKSSQPYELCSTKLSKISSYLLFTFEDILAAAPDASYNGYKTFVREYLEKGFLFECFIAGNIPTADVIQHDIAAEIERILSHLPPAVPAAESIPRFRDSLDFTSSMVKPPLDSVTSFDVVVYPPFVSSDPNIAVILDLCVGAATPRNKVLTEIAEKLIASRFFDALRSKETLGYVVFCGAKIIEQGAHIVFAVQSALDNADSLYLLSRIVAFLSAVDDNLDRVCISEDFEAVKTGLIQSLEKLPDSVYCDVTSLEYDYRSVCGLDNRARQIAEIKSISLEELKDFFRSYILNGRTHTCGLVVVIDSARCASVNPLSAERAAGQKLRLKLPPKHQSMTGQAPTEHSEGDLELPTFEDEIQYVEIRCIDDITTYRKDRRVLRSHTF